MKSAEAWADEMPDRYSADENWIKQIQLDAMKEGMQRAARINRGNMDKWRLTKEKDAGWGAEVSALDILTAAEQLTEKDLT